MKNMPVLEQLAEEGQVISPDFPTTSCSVTAGGRFHTTLKASLDETSLHSTFSSPFPQEVSRKWHEVAAAMHVETADKKAKGVLSFMIQLIWGLFTTA